jgi:two-component system, chemotaxis family, chemotaxis protein CheY
MSKRVLIVDDSRVARMIVRRLVSAIMPDGELVEAGNATEAMAAADEHSFDFALVDYNMPGDDGLTVAANLSQQQPELRIALLTANVQTPVRERTAELGIDFIGKPPTEEKIKAFLEASS